MPAKYTLEQQTSVFWSRVAITADNNQCWLWVGGKDSNGYGLINLYGKNDRVHRVAWRYPNYIIPEGMEICHSCDNPACCNPKHLFLGTHKENMDDMNAKGRNVNVRGESVFTSKLTEFQVLEIRRRYAAGGITQKQLGIEYGIATINIWMIIHRRHWDHV